MTDRSTERPEDAPDPDATAETPPAPGPRPEADRPLLLQVIGLQRSGNHAIVEWIEAQFERPLFLNDRPHGFFADPDSIAEVNAAAPGHDVLIYSFEDTIERFQSGDRLLDSVAPVNAAAHADCRVARLLILRDPYNCWASRVRGHETLGLTSSPALDPFLANWSALAQAAEADPDGAVLYNRWKEDVDYRRALSARLGGTFSDATMNRMTPQGSSFDQPRPSLRDMVGRLGYYVSPLFWQRFLRNPLGYLRRLVAPPQSDVRALAFDRRWTYVIERPEARALFEDAALGALSDRLFGFHVDAAGTLHAVAKPRSAGS